MAKNYYSKSKTKKAVIAFLAAAALTCTGFASACAKKPDEDKPTALAPKQEDTQLLKNGNFEFFDYPSDEYISDGKALYLIKTPDDWSRSGDSSNAMSGIIGTSSKAWEALTAPDLKGRLDYNSDLSSSDDDYIDYNGLKSRDLLYKDTYAALLSATDVKDSFIKNQGYKDYFGIVEVGGEEYFGAVEKADGTYDLTSARKVGKKPAAEGETEDIEYYFKNEDGTLSDQSVRFALINNPASRYKFVDENGKSYYADDNGEKVTVYKDDNGNYFYDEDKKYPCENVLMVHNYPANSNYNGISQYYSSQSVTIEANTAAEISVWVKTSDIKFDKGYSQLNDQDRGAFIEVVQTVNGTSIDSFKIKAINTEKIIRDNPTVAQSNGWLKYTIYVNGCDFANSTVQINLGLGQSANSEKCTGYAFFDDVTVTKLLSFDEKDDKGNFKSSYNANAGNITAATTCTLTSEKDDKVFIADTDDRYNASDKTSPDYLRHSRDFHYYIDLASEHKTDEGTNTYSAIEFNSGNTEGALTSEKSDKVLYYASSEENNAMVSGISKSADKYILPENLKESIITEDDLLGAFGVAGVSPSNFNHINYTKKLNDALTGDNGFDKLPGYTDGTSNMLVMLSARGAAYTSTVKNDTLFKLDHDERMIISFWVKTSDMDGNTAATIKVVDVDDEKNSASFALDTTDKTTAFGDNKDIYNGWVQCFLFVENTADEKDETTKDFVKKTFKIEFSFGNTSIESAAASSYNFGWAAFANLQVLKDVPEKIYNLTTSGSNSAKFSFDGEDDETENHPFAEVGGVDDIKAGLAKPNGYTGANGGSASVGGKGYSDAYNSALSNELNGEKFAGLLNKDEFEKHDDWLKILSDFTSATTAAEAWRDAFGDDCWQPLVIKSTLRYYAVIAGANEQSYKYCYVEAEDDYEGEVVKYNGKDYRKVDDSEEYSEETKYYNIEKAVNYGYIGESKSISADGYETVTVRVKASENAVAYVYLVNNDTNEVLSFSTPAYTFCYDNEGNVLNKEYSEDMKDDEHSAAIVYIPREDGLYNAADSADKNVYANVKNLVKSYKYYKYEENKFYADAACEHEILFDNLVDGETYYSAKDKEADHFLCTAGGTRVYEFADGKYYYLVNGERGTEVLPFDTEKAPLRYEAANGLKYEARVTGEDSKNGWVTVNFFIHTGSEAVDYRLEVWYGERGVNGVNEDGTYAQGTVAFDYSAYSVTSSNFDNLRGEYEKKIINEYKKGLTDEQLKNVDPDKESIAYYENLAGETGVNTVKDALTYTAKYYTYTLYDSDTYEPFNADVAKDGETGYSFNITDYEEKLAYFTFVNDKANSFNIFADYSAVEQNIERTAPETPDDDNKDDNKTDANIWLYVASIVLVVALLITLVSLLLRDFFKKNKRRKSDKSLQKNNYRQRKRYIRKLHLVDSNADNKVDDNAVESAPEEVNEEPAEEAPETAETVEEATVENTENNVDLSESAEETPAEVSEETPASGEASDNSESTPADNPEDKPE